MKEIEQIYICALDYALGRRTYIVGIVVDFLMKQELSDKCKYIMRNRIKECKDYGMEMDKKDWMKLLTYLKK